jgi:hypothetical protein
MRDDINKDTPELKVISKVVPINGTSPFYQLVDDTDYAYMVDFEISSADAIVLPYGYFISAYFSNNSTLEIKFNNWEVTICGRNLRPIYKGIVRQKLKYVRMAAENELDSNEYDSFVSSIKVVNTHERVATNMYRAESDVLPSHTENADKPEQESNPSF